MTFWEQALLFRAVGTNSRSRRTRTTRFRGEVTSVVTNVQRHHLKNSAGEATRRADSGAISPGLSFEATPRSQELWSPAGLAPCASSIGEVSLLFHHRRNL